MSEHPGVPIRAVAIGASAGGVEALGRLLQPLPADFAPAILIVLHLPPGRPSLMPGILSHRCRLRVVEGEDKQPIEGGTVYCAPADCHMQVEPDFTLSLSIDAPLNYSRPAIDVLFDSAAYAYGESLLGIVLTGASSDGAQGLATIRSAGGLGWVQSPDDAAVSTMPESAIATAGADRILGMTDMAEALVALGKQSITDLKAE